MDEPQSENLINNVFRPGKSYHFPKTSGSSFQYACFASYFWLCCSPSTNGAYCLPCVLFGDRYPDKVKANNIRKLFSEPLTCWGDATCAFNDRIGVQTGAVKRFLHHSTSAVYNSYLKCISGSVQPTEVMTDTCLRNTIAENRKSLFPLWI